MKLAVFDVDGTLTNTSEVDSVCFKLALAEAHAIAEVKTWDTCHHITDSGITLQIFQELLGRAPDDEELTKLKGCFINLLREHHQRDAQHFAEITGAASLLNRLRQETDWAIAIATGCWQESARLKLKAADIHHDGIPAAFAEDSIAREEIVQTAVARASTHYQQASFEKIVSIGDGVWDVRTAANLGLAFIGVAGGERAELLRTAGAKHIVEDLHHAEAFFRLLHEAEVPEARKAATI
jgi:phosphoglycolate phosphatase-like HAD superfamily hydrolase